MNGIAVQTPGGLTLYRPIAAQRRWKRRAAGLLTIILVAGSGALVNALQVRVAFEARSSATADLLPAGPFSYFPR